MFSLFLDVVLTRLDWSSLCSALRVCVMEGGEEQERRRLCVWQHSGEPGVLTEIGRALFTCSLVLRSNDHLPTAFYFSCGLSNVDLLVILSLVAKICCCDSSQSLVQR